MPDDAQVRLRDDRKGVVGAGAVGAEASSLMERSEREVEARFRQFAAMAPIGVIFMDADGRATYVNRRWSEITGYTTEQGLGGGWIRAIHKEDRAFVLESTRPALVRGQTTDIVHRIVRPSGDIAWVRGRAAAVLGADGGVIGFTASVEDISAEREARAETERLGQILEQTTEFVSIIDVSGRLLYANERLRQFFGIEPGFSITESSAAATRLTEDSRRRLTKEALTSLRRYGTWTGELELISAQGDTVTILQSSRLHHDEAGNPAFVSGIGRDVTELKEAQRRLEASEARFRSIAQHSNDLVAVVDMSGRYVYTSPSHHRVIGYKPDELIGRSPLELLHPDDRKRAEREFTVQILSETRAEPTPIEFRHRHREGGWRYIEAIASNLATDPAVGGVVVNARDVTDRRRSADLSTAQAAILERAARHAPLDETVSAVADMIEPWIDGSVVIGLLEDDGSTFRIAAANRFPQECIDELDGMSLSVPRLEQWTRQYGDERVFRGDLEAFRDLPRLAIPLRAAGFRTWSGILIRQSEAHDPLGAVYVISQSDGPLGAEDAKLLEIAADLAALCIERTRTADRLNHLALHDALTGLPNRALVTERLERVAASTQGDQSAAVLFLDLDRFKVINDSIGHDAGDRILVELGRRLRAELRPRDLVGRFGGDEFVIIAEQLHATSAALELAQRILEIVRRANSFGDRELVVTASIGVAMVDRGDADALLRDADAAMYAAKAGGRARVELFTPDLHARATARLETEGGLRRALAMNELEMHYQPAVALESGVLLGFEALIRWQHPTRGLLSADDFVGVAEETGLLRSIGLFAIEEACRQGAKWLQHAGWGTFVMGVNASSSQFGDPGFVTELDAILERTGMPPRFLAIEITERTIIDEGPVAQETMLELRGRGIGLVLDDFGTGYSSLVHLKRFPIQTLKIDRSFVEGMATNADDRAIVGAVVALGRQLGLYTVAEGVQTAEHLRQLREVGCDIAQGNWWCQPLPGPAIEQLLGDRSPVVLPGRD